MNSKKFKNVLYEFREIADLKDMVDSSARLFAEKDAYLVKKVPDGEYLPVKYGQVKKDIDAIGTRLIDMGLKGKHIAVIGENSYKWVISYLSVVNGTGVVVPLDRELQPKEIANLLDRGDVSAVIYSKRLEKKMLEAIETAQRDMEYKICMDESEENNVLNLDELIREGAELVENGDNRFTEAEIDREEMCSLLFTSGTTGLAKGVMLSHKNITANVYNMSKYVKIAENDVGLSVLPMHHSYELTCHIFTGFYQGMTIAICEGLKHITKNMAEAPANVMLSVPLIFETMHKKVFKQAKASGKLEKMKKMMAVSKALKLYNRPELLRKIFKEVHEAFGGHIHIFIAGGAAIDPAVIEDFQALGLPMIQGYGMTESAPIIAVNKIHYSKPASVGLPMPGTEIRILDPDEKGVGEILCRSDSVMIGYYKNPEETAAVLQGGWLHTGDYGYFDKEGFLYICGRKKSVIVTKNGKNIFPEEVEFYLQQSEFIAEVLVHGIEDERSGDTVVKAEIYLDRDAIKEVHGEMSEKEIRDLIKNEIDTINEQMPPYKRVKRFGIRETEFEKTTTRKIKRFSKENMGE